MGLNNIVGQVARGTDFFDRPIISGNIWRKIECGSNIILAAPRRVGKTSIMNNIKDNPKEGFYMIYVITESARTENEYYKAIVESIMNCKHLRLKDKAKLKTNNFVKKSIKSIEEIGLKHIKMKKSEEIDYHKYFETIIKTINLKEKNGNNDR
ncbi:MAG: hypothetical protein N4A48_11555 [Tepidibacter sp.]|uniref:hypothetical protein n=1 Tax=Tepidibacter sp. TaxID=2529387 RepID=UPI0025E10B73|nr:hypothetical protein [Tepidibacter sp.]MCT4509364.1 hypothetical protein [Tepidibacter sp.]